LGWARREEGGNAKKEIPIRERSMRKKTVEAGGGASTSVHNTPRMMNDKEAENIGWKGIDSPLLRTNLYRSPCSPTTTRTW